MRILPTIAILLAAPCLYAQGLGQIFDSHVTNVEREVHALAERMPAEKYNFAPTTGNPPGATFDGVRNFGQQVKHIATVMYMISSSVLGGEKPPVEIGQGEEGPASVQTKEQILAYFRGAVEFSHKAMRSLTNENAMQPVPPPFANPTRAGAAAFLGLHSFDHYGQMVVYARMNGVIPGFAPPAQGKGKGKGK